MVALVPFSDRADMYNECAGVAKFKYDACVSRKDMGEEWVDVN